MENKIIYKRAIPLKVSRLVALVSSCLSGYVLIDTWIYISQYSIQAPVGLVALSLFSLALFIQSLRGKAIAAINYQPETNTLQLVEQSLFMSRLHTLRLEESIIELRATDNKKRSYYPKMKLVLRSQEQGEFEIHTSVFGLNNSKLRQAHYLLKQTKELMPISK